MKITPDLVIFVTGGASGLGEETVRMLHARGCKLSIADMNEDKMNSLRNELGPERLICFKCDVSVEEDVKNAIKGTVDKFGAIHVALASAGVSWPNMTLTSKSSLDMKLFKKIFDINVFGSMYVAKYAAEFMSKN